MGRILVVDDDADILKMAEALLTHAGHIVITANDAIKAMQYLDQFEFDMLISDANMPHFTGFDLLQTVRKQVKHRNLAVAMLTGRRERKDIELAIRIGVDDYIVKPLDPMILGEKIEALFRKRPPGVHPEIKFPEANDSNEAQLRTALHVMSISELGAKVLVSFPLSVGEVVDVRGEVFEAIGFQPPPMKVLSCEPVPQGYLCQLLFVGATESMLQKIRRWIYSHGSANREAA